MAQLKLVTYLIDDEGNLTVDIGPGTHGADCADIIHTVGEAVGVVERDIWRPEENCSGDCGRCETNYHTRMAELRGAR
jgi:hypothetical protein